MTWTCGHCTEQNTDLDCPIHGDTPVKQPTKIQTWFDGWITEHEASTLIYKKGAERQIMFVRDRLASLIYRDVEYKNLPPSREAEPEGSKACPVMVIGEHASKSCRLPVYSIDRPDRGLRLILRGNFHDWNVSVISKESITRDQMSGFERTYGRASDRERFPNGYEPGKSWGYCFFQGFPEEFQFGPWSENPWKFSLCVGDEYALYAFVWALTKGMAK